ncbi:MAG: RNA polymerase sigma-70 factor [Rhizobiales bacterium]|nr:RNA polymerase sigma-70 factor [Hyphomicrobiales bacterium]
MSDQTGAEQIFHRHRDRAQAVAYRMLGSRTDAEDIVQEVWLRWNRAPRDDIVSPEAWIVTTTARLALDQLRSAQARRETYVGPWLPEPIISRERDAMPTPEDALSLADDVSMALLHMLERLAPEERVAFLMHDVFDYDHHEVSTLLGKSEPACRQIVSRARKRVKDESIRFNAGHRAHAELAKAFRTALETADLDGLLACLAPDAVLYSDGGGKAAAALNPIYTADHIARFFLGISRKMPAALDIAPVLVNGQPGYVLHDDKTIHSVTSFAVSEGKITTVYMIRNPDKLARVARDIKLAE